MVEESEKSGIQEVFSADVVETGGHVKRRTVDRFGDGDGRENVWSSIWAANCWNPWVSRFPAVFDSDVLSNLAIARRT